MENEVKVQKNINIYILIGIIVILIMISIFVYFLQYQKIKLLELENKRVKANSEQLIVQKTDEFNDENDRYIKEIETLKQDIVLSENIVTGLNNNLEVYKNDLLGIEVYHQKGWELRGLGYSGELEYKNKEGFTLTKTIVDREWNGSTGVSVRVTNNDSGFSLADVVKNTDYKYQGDKYVSIDGNTFFNGTVVAWGMVGAQQFLGIVNGRIYDIIVSGLDYNHSEIDELIHDIKFTEPKNNNLSYYNTTIGLGFQYTNVWPEPVFVQGDRDFYRGAYPNGKKSQWTIYLGDKEKGFCEGQDCYVFEINGYFDNDLELVTTDLNNDELISVIDKKEINNAKAIIYNEGGISETKNAFVFSDFGSIRIADRSNSENFDTILNSINFVK